MPRPRKASEKLMTVAEAAFKDERAAQELLNKGAIHGKDTTVEVEFDNRPHTVKNDLDYVSTYCDRVEKTVGNELNTLSDGLRRNLKDLKRERTTILETLSENQAKVTLINRTLQNVAFRMEGEKALDTVGDSLEE